MDSETRCDPQANYVVIEGVKIPRICGGKGSSAPARTETINKSEPWAGQKPFLEKGFAAAEQDILNRPLEFFPNQTYAGFSPETEAALGAQTQRAVGGSPVFNAGQNQLMQTLGGDYLNQGNPYSNDLLNRITGDVTNSVSSQFANSGRFGSPGMMEALGRGITKEYAPLQFGAYEAERGRQMGAVPQAQAYGNQPYTDIAALSEVGAAREALSQQDLNEQMARHTFGQMEPTERIAQYMNLVSGNTGMTNQSVTTNQGGGGGVAGPLGFAAAIGSQFIPKPKGAIEGTVICTAYYELGFIDRETYSGDEKFGFMLYRKSPWTWLGYYAWANPIAKFIKRHRWAALMLWPVARPVIMEISAQGNKTTASIVGRLVLSVGLPVCRMIGERVARVRYHAVP